MSALTSHVCAIGRDPTPDELAGICWWNGLTEAARIFWLEAASCEGRRLCDVSAADAWAEYKCHRGEASP